MASNIFKTEYKLPKTAIVLLFTVNTMKREADTLQRIPTCGYPDHIHTEACLDMHGHLDCKIHVHTDACYQERPKKHAPVETIGHAMEVIHEDDGTEILRMAVDPADSAVPAS